MIEYKQTYKINLNKLSSCNSSSFLGHHSRSLENLAAGVAKDFLVQSVLRCVGKMLPQQLVELGRIQNLELSDGALSVPRPPGDPLRRVDFFNLLSSALGIVVLPQDPFVC